MPETLSHEVVTVGAMSATGSGVASLEMPPVDTLLPPVRAKATVR